MPASTCLYTRATYCCNSRSSACWCFNKRRFSSSVWPATLGRNGLAKRFKFAAAAPYCCAIRYKRRAFALAFGSQNMAQPFASVAQTPMVSQCVRSVVAWIT
jgi:hypothetical protein